MTSSEQDIKQYPLETKDLKVEVDHLEHGVSRADHNDGDAISAEKAELDQTIWNAVQNNRRAVLWSIIVSMCVVMESYDLQLVGNLMAQPGQFQNVSPSARRLKFLRDCHQRSSARMGNI